LPGIKEEFASDGYKKQFGIEPKIAAIHAGLECGLIGGVFPNLDMISFGPTMFDVHSPAEKLKIDSVSPFYDLLKNVLKSIPKN
jgi:dipeptidase D